MSLFILCFSSNRIGAFLDISNTISHVLVSLSEVLVGINEIFWLSIISAVDLFSRIPLTFCGTFLGMETLVYSDIICLKVCVLLSFFFLSIQILLFTNNVEIFLKMLDKIPH